MHEINRVGVCFILKHTANLPHLNFIRIFSRIDRGQYGNRSSHNKKLKHQVNGTYDWKCMVLLRKDTNNPSLNAIGESLARAFNNHNKKSMRNRRSRNMTGQPEPGNNAAEPPGPEVVGFPCRVCLDLGGGGQISEMKPRSRQDPRNEAAEPPGSEVVDF